ncbi:MAG: hypothetical protein ACM3SW_02390 [Actinomycetota bacterium]
MSDTTSTLSSLHSGASAAKHVRMIRDDGGVDQNEVRISLSNHEEVVWTADNNRRATIRFKAGDSPFQDTVFHVPAGGSVTSGPARNDAVPETEHKYTVEGPSGNNDPIVIIQR